LRDIFAKVLYGIETTNRYLLSILSLSVDFNPKNIIIFAILLGGVAHVMLFQDGYWHDFMWISASLTIIVPVLAYRYMKISKQKRKQRKTYADI